MIHGYHLFRDDILLCPLSDQNLEKVRIWRNQDKIRNCFFFSGIVEEEAQRRWFASYSENPDDLMFVIQLVESGVPQDVGAVALYNINLTDGIAEFGRLMIGEGNIRGKGVAKKASALICDFGLTVLGLKTIILDVFSDNTPAISIYQSIGFETDGTRSRGGRDIMHMHISRGKR